MNDVPCTQCEQVFSKQQLCDCHLLLLPVLFDRSLLFDGRQTQELAVLQITEAEVKHTCHRF